MMRNRPHEAFSLVLIDSMDHESHDDFGMTLSRKGEERGGRRGEKGSLEGLRGVQKKSFFSSLLPFLLSQGFLGSYASLEAVPSLSESLGCLDFSVEKHRPVYVCVCVCGEGERR